MLRQIRSLDDPSASFLDNRYGKRRMWGALGFGVASLTSGFICDASGGGYGGVMVQFVIVTTVALVTATGVSIGKNREAVLQQSRATIRYVFQPCMTVCCAGA